MTHQFMSVLRHNTRNMFIVSSIVVGTVQAQTVTPTLTPTPTSILTGTPKAGSSLMMAEGIDGDLDRDERAPRITIDVKVLTDGGVKILADGQVPNKDYRGYPIQYDFFINNRLVSSQVYSRQLPGPIGVDLSENEYPLPFNYTIKAHVLHPNRTFTTVAFGAVDESMRIKITPTPIAQTTGGAATPNPASQNALDCNVTSVSSDGDNTDGDNYENSNVTISQSDSLLTASFQATSTTGTTVNVEFTVTATGAETDDLRPIEGTAIVKQGSASETLTVEGEMSLENGVIIDIAFGDASVEKLDVFCGNENSTATRRLVETNSN